MTRSLLLCSATLVLLAGCGRDGDRAERAADTMAANVAAGTDSLGGTISNGAANATDDLDIEELNLGRTVGADGKIADKTDEFRPNDEIIAVLETDDNASGKELIARWTYGDNEQVVNEERQTVAAGSDARTTFRLKKAGAWPVGKYHLRVMYNGREVKSEEFEVKSN
jgi:hypothetical protein